MWAFTGRGKTLNQRERKLLRVFEQVMTIAGTISDEALLRLSPLYKVCCMLAIGSRVS